MPAGSPMRSIHGTAYVLSGRCLVPAVSDTGVRGVIDPFVELLHNVAVPTFPSASNLGKSPAPRHDSRVQRMSPAKPPLEPKWAVILSLGAFPGGLLPVAAAHLVFLVPLATALLWYALVVYFVAAFSWSSLERRTRHAAIRGNNAFVIFTVCLLILLIIVQDEHEAFPTWATVLLVVAGVAGYSVMGIHGVRNFLRWRRGDIGAGG